VKCLFSDSNHGLNNTSMFKPSISFHFQAPLDPAGRQVSADYSTTYGSSASMTSSLMSSQACQASPEYLLSWANHQISVLEESLEHIAHTKTQLRDHAQEVGFHLRHGVKH
jgi:hypothetical protein